MLSNHRMKNRISSNLLQKAIIKTFLHTAGYLFLLTSIGLLTQWLELNTSSLHQFHEFLKQREIGNRLISHAYITLSIGVLSIGSIMFTLMIGKIQSLINEVNYSSFHRKTFKDGKILNDYIWLMSVSIVLLFFYLLFDTSVYPLTYLTILLVSFLTVVYILYSLFTSIIEELDLFRILEKNYQTISVKLDELKDIHKKIRNLVTFNEKLKSNIIGKLTFFTFDKKLEMLKLTLVVLRNRHLDECIQSVKELDYMVVTSCRRKDPELLQVTLDYTEKHIKHLFEVENFSLDKSIFFSSKLDFRKSYKNVVYDCLTIYEKPELYRAEYNLAEIAYNGFSGIINDRDLMEQNGKEMSDSDFKKFIRTYLNVTVAGIKRNSNFDLFTYNNDVNNLLAMRKFKSIAKYQIFSFGNITLANELTAVNKTEDLHRIFDVQSKILYSTLMDKKLWHAYALALRHFFDLFEGFINNLNDSKSFDIMHTLSSCLDNDENASIPQSLSAYIRKIDSIGLEEESSTLDFDTSKLLLNHLVSKSNSIIKAIRLDESVFFGFESILNRIIDILRKYIGLKKTTYHMRLIEESLKQYCDYLLVYNGFDNWHAFIEMERTFKKLFHDDNVKESAINAYVDLIKMIVINNIKISKSANETDKLFLSTIDIEGIIVQMYYFEDYIFESILNKIDLLLSTEELEFLLEHVIGLIVELNAELSNELFDNEVPSDISKSEFKRELGSLIGLYIEASQAYDNNES